MAEIFQKRTLTGWIPADAPSEDAWRKQKLGEVYQAKVTKPRNYGHHCLFMVLLNEITFPNQEVFENAREFRRAIAEEAGWVEEYRTLQGEIKTMPKPYDYEHLPDEEDFTVEFGKAMAVCAAILHMTCPDLEDEVSKYASDNFPVECPRIFRPDYQERAA